MADGVSGIFHRQAVRGEGRIEDIVDVFHERSSAEEKRPTLNAQRPTLNADSGPDRH
jgi:hypothetical protein